MKSDMILWHDSDGCFANFDLQANNLLGCHPSNMDDTTFWAIAKNEPKFWTTMPLIDGAIEYWNKIKHLNPIILTGAPKDNFEFAEKAKKDWWLEHFNHTNVIVCLSKNKHTFVTDANDVLVDDTERIVKRFINAGGRAILHRNYNETLIQLYNIGFLF